MHELLVVVTSIIAAEPSSSTWLEWNLIVQEGGKLTDQSGHGHDLTLPATGFTPGTFGVPRWDGTQRAATVADSPDFAPKTPFNVQLDLELPEGGVKKPGHLVRRVGDADKTDWALDLLPGPKLRFTVGSASVEGALGPAGSQINAYANLDTETGELSLYEGCHLLGKKVTDQRPGAELSHPRLELFEGFTGTLRDLRLSRGVMLPVEPVRPNSCRLVGSKYQDPSLRERPSTWDKVVRQPEPGQGVARAKLGDEVEFRLQLWRRFPPGTENVVRATVKVRRVAGDLPFTFEVSAAASGEWRREGGAIRWGPSESNKLFGYAENVPLAEVLSQLVGNTVDADAEHHPAAAPCRLGGLTVKCEESTEQHGKWRRKVAREAPAVALSGGLLQSIHGDPKGDDTHVEWEELTRVGRGPPTSDLTTVQPLGDARSTPFIAARGVALRLASDAAEKVDLQLDAAREALRAPLEACSPAKNVYRRQSQLLLARFDGGKLRGLDPAEKDGAKVPKATVDCVRAAANKLSLSPELLSLPLEWIHEGPESDIERTIRETTENQLRAFGLVCLEEQHRVGGGKKAAVVLVAIDGKVTSATLAGEPDPELLDCVAGRLQAPPLPGVAITTRVEETVQLR